MEYLLKSTLISSSIYLFYKLFLTKETFFQSIRWYFLVGMAISLLLPLLIIPIYIEVAPFVQPEIIAIPELLNSPEIQPELSQIPIEKPFNWIGFMSIIYIIGIVFLGLKFLFELFSLFRLIKINNKKKIQNYYFVETADNISPFSFFNYIVYNKKQFSIEELSDIISHEKVHVNQNHSIDNILIQLFVVFQWFNPFVWMYKKDLQQNLEYIADKTAQKQSLNNKKYQYLLLKTSIKNNSFALSNNFFNSHLKKRIIMLQKSQTKKLNQLKYVLLLPLIALFLYSFNTKEVFIVKEEKQNDITIKNSSLKEKVQPIFIVPVHKDNIKSVSGYGMRVNPITKKKSLHKGTDYNVYENMDVYAAADGEVVKTGFDNEKGNFIEIKHDNGFQTNYLHLGNIQVAKYEKVKRGEIIGIVGSTGKSVAPHLHFEVLKDGKQVNPLNYLEKKASQNNKTKRVKKPLVEIESKISSKNVDFYSDNKKLQKDSVIQSFIIKNNATDYEINQKVIEFRNKFNVELDVFGIERNKYDEIISINIIAKKDDLIKKFSLNDSSSFYSITISYIENKFYINKQEDKSVKHILQSGETISSIAEKYNISIDELIKMNTDKLITVGEKVDPEKLIKVGSRLFVQKDKRYVKKNDTSFKGKNKRLVQLLDGTKENSKTKKLKETQKNLSNTGWLYYNNKTYFYLINKNEVTFYTRYGTKPNIDISKELLTLLNKEKNKLYSLVFVEQIENNGKSYNGYLSYNDEHYFYTKINGELVFLDKFGKQVSTSLNKILLSVLDSSVSNHIKYKGKYYFYTKESDQYIFNDEYVDNDFRAVLLKEMERRKLARRIKMRKKIGYPLEQETQLKQEHKTGEIWYNGKAYIYSQDIHVGYGCQECDELLIKLSKSDRLKGKKITTKTGYTITMFHDVSPTIFYDKFGKTVNDIKLIDKLFKKLNNN